MKKLKGIISTLSAFVIGTAALSPYTKADAAANLKNTFFISDGIIKCDVLTSYPNGEYPLPDVFCFLKDYYPITYGDSTACASVHNTTDTSNTLSKQVIDQAAEKNWGLTNANNFIISMGMNDILSKFHQLIKEDFPDLEGQSRPGTIINFINAYTAGELKSSKAKALINKLKEEATNTATNTVKNFDSTLAALKKVNKNANIYIYTLYNPFLTDAQPSNNVPYCKEISDIYATYMDIVNKNIKNSGAKCIDISNLFTVEGSNGKSGIANRYIKAAKTKAKGERLYPNEVGIVAITLETFKTLKASSSATNTEDIRKATKMFYETYSKLQPQQHAQLLKLLGYSKCDYNKDGAIDASDASAVLAYYSNHQTSTSNPSTTKEYTQHIVMDADANGTVDASDASLILAHYSSMQTGGSPLL